MATIKPKSVLIGFSVCPLCGGKTHVKRIEADGKRPYSHCLDEHDKGCSHTHYATNAGQEALMLAKTRPLAIGGPTATATAVIPSDLSKVEILPSATPTPAKAETKPQAAPAPVATATPPTPTPTPTPNAPAKPKRSSLFGI